MDQIPYLGPPEYAGLLTAFILMLIGVNCEWIVPLCTRNWRQFEQCQKQAEEMSNIAFTLHGYRAEDMPSVKHDPEFVTRLRKLDSECELLTERLTYLGVYVLRPEEDNNVDRTLDILTKIRGCQSLSLARKKFAKQVTTT